MRPSVVASSAVIAALLGSLTARSASASSPPTCAVVARGGTGDVADAELWSFYPDYPVPAWYEVGTGYVSSVGQKRTLFRFDLGAVPAGALVSSARFYALAYSSTQQTVRVHNVIAPWVEDAVTWNNFGGADPAPIASFVSGGTFWAEMDLTGLVRDWVGGALPNYGVLLEEDLDGFTAFKSSDHDQPGYRPYLEVCYTAPKASIGDRVWFDANADGIEEASEQGIAGVVLDLFGDVNCDGAADTPSLAAVATDALGGYRFGDLDPGCYVIDVDDATLPLGHVLTTVAEPLDVSVAAGETVTDADIGYVTISSIGDTVWLDSDADGAYEPETGEVGVNGVLVELYQGATLVDTTVTGFSPYSGEPGFYLFDTLPPGVYRVVVTPDNFGAGGPLAGQEPTADRDGGSDNAATIALGAGQDLRTVDFGYQMTCGNGVCSGDEGCSSCAQDCGSCAPVCGDGTCAAGEDCTSCAADCNTCPAVCGDGACEAGESCSSCAADCGVCPPVCGDGACAAGESCTSCASDCGQCPAVCGNGACETGEDCQNCAGDCGRCPAACGNDVCEAGESCLECPSDCGICPPVCGDGACTVGESCSSCGADCGRCAPVCGDHTCSAGEDCASCSSDCGVCPPAAYGTVQVGYWKNHEGAWPVQQLKIGGRTYSQAQLLAILRQPPRGDVTYLVARQLIAAKLNVGAGNLSSCIESAIAQADAWLTQNPVGSNVKAGGKSSPWRTGEPLADALKEYNQGSLCAPHHRAHRRERGQDAECGSDDD